MLVIRFVNKDSSLSGERSLKIHIFKHAEIRIKAFEMFDIMKIVGMRQLIFEIFKSRRFLIWSRSRISLNPH